MQAHRAGVVVLAIAVLAGAAGASYGLARAFGVGRTHHVVIQTQSAGSHHRSPSTRSGQCSDQTAEANKVSESGAAGTISAVWRVTNTSDHSCTSSGYPGMDFHTADGWLNVQVHRGGYAIIDQQPQSVTVPGGGALQFTSLWGDATTSAGNCRQFDRVKITLPNNTTSIEVPASGCMNPDSVHVGPVSLAPAT